MIHVAVAAAVVGIGMDVAVERIVAAAGTAADAAATRVPEVGSVLAFSVYAGTPGYSGEAT